MEEYYDIAPTIVKRIGRRPDRKEIYERLYRDYLLPCIRSIEARDYDACQERYQKMVLDLKTQYIH